MQTWQAGTDNTGQTTGEAKTKSNNDIGHVIGHGNSESGASATSTSFKRSRLKSTFRPWVTKLRLELHVTSREWWCREIPSPMLLHPLYLISFVTGFTDPGTYAVFQTFASNQTGNVILLTLVAANDTSIEIHNTVASLASYLITGFLGGQIGHRVGLRSKWWLILSHVLQVLFLVVACILDGTSGLLFEHPGTQWIFLVLLAASSGLQVAISRNCGNAEVPTAMLSSPMIDLVTDKNIMKLAWRFDPALKARNIRFCYIFSLIAGSFVGAYVHKYAGFLVVIAITAGIKAIVLLWLLSLKGVQAG